MTVKADAACGRRTWRIINPWSRDMGRLRSRKVSGSTGNTVLYDYALPDLRRGSTRVRNGVGMHMVR